MRTVKLGKVVIINPTERLAKGEKVKFISMDKLGSPSKSIDNYEIKKFAGGMKFRNGDTLVARITPCLENGKTGFVDYLNDDEVGAGSTEYIVLRAINGITDQDYVYYLAISPEFRKHAINSMTGTSGRKRVENNKLANYTFELPDLQTQTEITSVLSALDKKILLNKKINTNLEKMARLVYDQWFVQFDFPDVNNRPYKSCGGAMVYNQILKREIPAGWSIGNLYKNELTEIIKPKINKFKGEKIYLATTNVNDIKIGVGSKITYDHRESRANMQPIANSVWFAKMQNSIKHILIGKWSKDLLENVILSTGFMGLKVKDFAFAYLTGFIRQSYFEIVKDKNSHGATMSGIGNDNMKNIKLVIPPDGILQKYSMITSPFLQQIDVHRQEAAYLTELRNWLLPMLMDGQIKVS